MSLKEHNPCRPQRQVCSHEPRVPQQRVSEAEACRTTAARCCALGALCQVAWCRSWLGALNSSGKLLGLSAFVSTSLKWK